MKHLPSERHPLFILVDNEAGADMIPSLADQPRGEANEDAKALV